MVDKAHHIGFTRSKSSLRTERLTPLCTRAKHLILLSATPSRGTHRDILNRISLLVPEASKHIKRLERNPLERRAFYEVISDYVVYRRLKEHVNVLESKEVFTRLHTFLALVRLGDYRDLYEQLGMFIGQLLKLMDPESPVILKIIVLKRALSSPYAFLKTFTKVVEERSTISEKVSYSDSAIERDPDRLVEASLVKTIKVIPKEVVKKHLSF